MRRRCRCRMACNSSTVPMRYAKRFGSSCRTGPIGSRCMSIAAITCAGMASSTTCQRLPLTSCAPQWMRLIASGTKSQPMPWPCRVCTTPVEAGVDSIEHGNYISDADLKTMAAKGIYYVPTIYVGEYVAEGRAKAGAPIWLQMLKIHEGTFRRALKAGVKIAFGTDIGGFDWKINPALEFPLMVKYGMTSAQAIQSATRNAADLLNMSDQIGAIDVGKFADIVATSGNPLEDVGALQKLDFVMKGGEVYKRP